MTSGIGHQGKAGGWTQTLTQWAATAESWPQSVTVAGGVLLFIVAWTLHGAIAGAGRSLHGDLLEAYAWGKEFQLGYNQHGPFWAWIAGAWFSVFPVSNASFVLLEAVNSGMGLLGVWMLAGLFVKGPARHAVPLLLLATPLYTVMAFKYNANTIFVSLWPWTLYFFVKSLDDLRLRDALFFGAMAAACILSKYYAAILLMTCGLSLFFHPNGRRYAASPLPWLAGAVFSACVAPHVLWALGNGAPPAAYAMSIAGKGWLFTAEHVGSFVRDTVTEFAGLFALLAVAWWLSRGRDTPEPVEQLEQSRRRFLSVLVVTPPLLTVAFALVFRLKIEAIMAVGIFPLAPLYLLQFVPSLDARLAFRLAAAVALLVSVGSVPAAPVERAVVSRKSTEPRRELAEAASALWHAEMHSPLLLAGGRAHYANAIAFYSEDHPSSLIELSFQRSRWVTKERIEESGILIACAREDEACASGARELLSGRGKQVSLSVRRKLGGRDAPEIPFDIFMLPPRAVRG
jgi:hypothetical protein